MENSTINSTEEIKTANSESGSQYYAFISYSRHDKRYAHWLQDYIQTRRIPKHLRRKANITGPTLQPVFRDESDLSSYGNLSDAIKNALEASHYLVVVCSPYAVASEYVKLEIDYFKSLGRSDRILCLIAGGIPNATKESPERASLECFPRAIRYPMNTAGEVSGTPLAQADLPLAADVRGSDDTLPSVEGDRIVAGLLGISLRELQQNLERQQLKRRLWLALLFFAFVASALLVWDTFLREHETYYKDYVRKFGKWEGVSPVNLTISPRPEKMYKFVRKGRTGPVQRVELVNATGRLAFHTMRSILGNEINNNCSTARAVIVEFEYDEEGQVLKEKWLSQYGREIEVIQYTGSSVAQFTEADFGCSRTPSGIQYVRYTRDLEGRDVKIEFLNRDRKPARNAELVYGYVFEWDDANQLVSKYGFDAEGRHSPDKNGIWKTKYERVARTNGAVETVRYLGTDGLPVYYEYVAGYTDIMDLTGNIVKRSFFDSKGKPTQHKGRMAGWTKEYDEMGNETKKSFFGVNGAPAIVNDGYSAVRSEYGEQGELLKIVYLDPQGDPVLIKPKNIPDNSTKKGMYAVEYFIHDENGEIIRTQYLGVDEEPTITTELFSEIYEELDSNGNIIQSSYLGLDGKHVINSRCKCSAYRREFDEQGRVTRSTTLDPDSNPIVDQYGFPTIVHEYDLQGRKKRSILYGPEGEKTLSNRGVAGWSNQYDSVGNFIKQSYFGLDGQPILNSSGLAGISDEYDSRGNRIKRSHLGLDGHPILYFIGTAGWSHEYDSRGNRIKRSYFGLDGQPTLTSGGLAGWSNEYDARGNNTKTSYFGLDNQPVLSSSGYAGWSDEYDARGNKNKKS
ncbi:MAG: TIR domain-containing protein [Cyclobacteriaceae bacterium]